jgi:hypothetical protein
MIYNRIRNFVGFLDQKDPYQALKLELTFVSGYTVYREVGPTHAFKSLNTANLALCRIPASRQLERMSI